MTNIEGAEDHEWAINEIRLGMQICGVYFNHRLPKWQQLLITLRAIFIVLIVFNLIVFPAIVAMIKVWGQLTLLTDNLIVFIPYTLAISHFITMWYSKEDIIELFQNIKEDWDAPKNAVEREIMMKNARIAKIIVRFTYIFVLWVIAIHNLPFWLFGIVPRTHTNLTDGDQPLIAQTVYIHDMNVDLNVRLTAIGQTVCSFTVGISYSTAGCIFFTFILHACGQLQILKMHLESIFDEDETKIDYKKISEAIAKHVRHHQRLIKFIATVEKVYHLMFLQQFIGITIALSTEEFLVISILVGDVEISTLGLIFCVFYTIYCAFMTLMYCSGGEFLIGNSIALYSAAYNSRWYNSQRTYRKELTMIINRAQRPMFITAGKFVPISLNTYARLIKTSASYMSVLLAAKS